MRTCPQKSFRTAAELYGVPKPFRALPYKLVTYRKTFSMSQ
jgi:hypothetical protein